MKKAIEGSKAVAEAVNNCRPAVISAYPITPQTHIVEELSKFKSDGLADFEFKRSDSEFAAASIVLGASAAGVRTYTATSSQGLLLMAEVLFTIAGLRLPVVMTCANRAVSAPINIWNDQQDSLTVRDSGWIMLYAEDNQEAVDMHLVAFKVAEQTRIPVMVNMDGFVLTHTIEPVDIPERKEVVKFLPDYSPEPGQFLDVKDPKSLGTLATPEDYMEIRQDLFEDMEKSKKNLKIEFTNFKNQFKRGSTGLIEYYGPKSAKTVIVSMGSVIGTIKDTVDHLNKAGQNIGVLKVKCFRPFPDEEITRQLLKFKNIAVIEKDVSLGNQGILATEIKALKLKGKVQSFIAGLGGRDITMQKVEQVYKIVSKKSDKTTFIN